MIFRSLCLDATLIVSNATTVMCKGNKNFTNPYGKLSAVMEVFVCFALINALKYSKQHKTKTHFFQQSSNF